MRLLIERRIDTGQERLAQLRPLVREAIKSGQRVHVGAGWWRRITVDQGRLEAELHPWVDGPVLVSMTVTPGEGLRPPVLEMGVAELVQAATDGRVTESEAAMATDLARCVAWAWLASLR